MSLEEKVYDLEQRLNAFFPGPWKTFNPLQNSWAVNTSLGWSGAWVRAYPRLGLVMMAAMMTVGTATDGTQIATIPATDTVGNNLRPNQIVPIPVGTDLQRLPATGNNNEGPRLHLGSGGALTVFGIAASATVAEVAGWYPLAPM
jgi:hypothetical protein